MAEKPMVNIQGLNSYYGKGKERKQVLRNVSLTLDPGEVLGIVGESGSGKSTLAKCLLGVVKDTEGTLEVNAFRPQMVFQDPYASLDPRMTVRDIIAEPLETYHVCANRQATTARVLELMQAVGIPAEFLHRYPHQFSGGQRQRLSIARALVKKAPVYIFDDTFSALDFKTDAALRHALKTEVADAAVLIVAQRINTILNADQIIVLDEGKIAGIGKHSELMQSCLVYQDIARSQMKGEA